MKNLKYQGNQLCSHHFISSLRRNGPAEKTGILKAGDELLQVKIFFIYLKISKK